MTDKQVDWINGPGETLQFGQILTGGGSIYSKDYHDLKISIMFLLEHGEYRVFAVKPLD
jgi:hypothetical protein